MIQLDDISFTYPTGGFSLKLKHLCIGKGEKLAIIGPSGSGKTTLLHLIAGILVPCAGEIKLDNQPLSTLSDSARRRLRLTRMGMVLQGIELVDYLSARDNVLLPCRINPGLRIDNHIRQRADDLITRVGLAQRAHQLASCLSQGERQRAGICRALLTRPDLVLADEPTASLDKANAQLSLDTLMQLVEEDGSTLVMLTHDPTLLPRFDRVISVEQGVVR